MACPVWNGSITVQDKMAIERIQKTALAIIRGDQYTLYFESLTYFGIDTLEVRREALCFKYALKAYKNTKFSSWFTENETDVNTRIEKLPLKTIRFRTRRYQKSPLPYLTNLLNSHLPTQIKAATDSYNIFLKKINGGTSPLSGELPANE